MTPATRNDPCDDLATHIANPARLAALRRVALLDTPTEESFDRLCALAVRFLLAPVALVSLVDADRQYFKSCIGLPEPWQSLRETPLSHSFCQHNRIPRRPLLIEDARQHPTFKDNPAIRDLKVVAYLGFPLVTSDGFVLGSFCVIDSRPRKWSPADVEVVESLTLAVMTEINLRAELALRREAETLLQEQTSQMRAANRRLEKEAAERLWAAEQLREKDRILMQQNRLVAMGEMINNIAHEWRQPLNLIALTAQELPIMYRRGDFDAAYLDGMTKKILDVVLRMSETLENFKSFFAPVGTEVAFSVAGVVKQTLALLNAAFASRQIATVLKVSGDPILRGYPNEYSMVLLSILENAQDALLASGVPDPLITVEVGAFGGRTAVSVTDNAGGIDERILDRVFDPYFTTKGPDKGTGVGLYIAKMIIDRSMKGRLMVNNVKGGARFTILV